MLLGIFPPPGKEKNDLFQFVLLTSVYKFHFIYDQQQSKMDFKTVF